MAPVARTAAARPVSQPSLLDVLHRLTQIARGRKCGPGAVDNQRPRVTRVASAAECACPPPSTPALLTRRGQIGSERRVWFRHNPRPSARHLAWRSRRRSEEATTRAPVTGSMTAPSGPISILRRGFVPSWRIGLGEVGFSVEHAPGAHRTLDETVCQGLMYVVEDSRSRTSPAPPAVWLSSALERLPFVEKDPKGLPQRRARVCKVQEGLGAGAGSVATEPRPSCAAPRAEP